MNKTFALAVLASALGLFLGQLAFTKYSMWEISRQVSTAKEG